MTLELPTHDALSGELWNALIEIASTVPSGWTLIGAQMVHLHGLEHDRVPPRRTADLDVVVDVRAVAEAPTRFAESLTSMGYRLEGAAATGVGHRFIRGDVKVDVLLPDGIGPRAPREVQRGVRSIEVPGGSQALRRSAAIEVRTASASGMIHRPNLLGAILVKARAVEVDDLPDAQREDLAFLLSLVPDPFEMAKEMSGKEAKWLGRRVDLLARGAPAWRAVDNADDGRLALGILVRAH